MARAGAPTESTNRGTRAPSALAELSVQLAEAVTAASGSIVAIHARRRIPSSGVVWRDGVIVSASHTVQRDDDISVTLASGGRVPAVLVGRDRGTDLVALRIEGRSESAALAEPGAARVGALVLAVGRPGDAVTASFGIISAVGGEWRTWQGARVEQSLRLDLSIYDGFSGGALVGADGRVLGVNSSALARGVPLALGAVTVNRVLDELLARGHVRRGYAGVGVQPVALSESVIRAHSLVTPKALLIVGVEDGGPADRAGLLVGDALLDAGGSALEEPIDLLDALAATGEGTPISLRILRGGGITIVQLTPVDRNAHGPGRGAKP